QPRCLESHAALNLGPRHVPHGCFEFHEGQHHAGRTEPVAAGPFARRIGLRHSSAVVRRMLPMMVARRFRLVVGISGATGIALGVRALELARAAGAETHLVVTRPADRTRAYETDLTARQLRALADFTHAIDNIGAAIASGSFEIDAMLVAPCSAHTLSAIAYGTGDNLLTRAADVTLKERRHLVLLVRETPLTLAPACNDCGDRNGRRDHASAAGF